MSGFTSLEAQVLALSDAGMHPAKIARKLQCSLNTSQSIVWRYAVTFDEERRLDENVREGTRALGIAVMRAGGHCRVKSQALREPSSFEANVRELKSLGLSVKAIARELDSPLEAVKAALLLTGGDA
ncbi:MAG: hypothetical protein AAFR88_09365 [Pseudomonadota bacterium]